MDEDTERMLRLHHYYHVYADGNWEPIVAEHIDALQHSGLLDRLEKFNVGLVGDWRKREDVIEYIQHRIPHKTWCIAAEADEGWEQVTLDALASDMRHVYGKHVYVLYCHTKGGAYSGPHQDQWRRRMMHSNVTDWPVVIEQLTTKQWDVAGCHVTKETFYEEGVQVFAGVHGGSTVQKLLMAEADGAVIFEEDYEEGEPVPIGFRYHFSGNFWWADNDWIRRLPPCPNNARHSAEMWVTGVIADGTYPRMLDLAPGSPFDRRDTDLLVQGHGRPEIPRSAI